MEVLKVHLDEDNVHIMVSVLLYISVSRLVRVFEGRT